MNGKQIVSDSVGFGVENVFENVGVWMENRLLVKVWVFFFRENIVFNNVHVWMEKRLCVIVDFKMENIRQCGCLDGKQIVCGKVAFEWEQLHT